MEELNKQLFLSINQYTGNSHFIDFIMLIVAKFMLYFFIGILYFHPRPFMENLGTTLLNHKPENSFPSDHTTFTLSIALMFITFKSTRILGIVLSILALWCGIARIYAGVHWPFDIMGSIITSTLAVIFIFLLKSTLMKLNDIIINIWNKIFKVIK